MGYKFVGFKNIDKKGRALLFPSYVILARPFFSFKNALEIVRILKSEPVFSFVIG